MLLKFGFGINFDVSGVKGVGFIFQLFFIVLLLAGFFSE